MYLYKNKPKIIILTGPTASGKTILAMELYHKLPIEIISVDSALVYKEMNIGTSKPTLTELTNIPHHLINIRDPSEHYSMANFYYDALLTIKKILKNNHIPLLVGGSMMYFNILFNGISKLPSANINIRNYIQNITKNKGKFELHKILKTIDPISAKRIHFNDIQRISRALEVFFISGKTLTELICIPTSKLPYQIYKFAILPSKDLLYKNIKKRFYYMLSNGFEQEVNFLFRRKDLHKEMSSIKCIGYKQMWSYLSNEISYSTMKINTIYATYRLAKKQINWLHKWNNLSILSNLNINIIIDKILNKIK